MKELKQARKVRQIDNATGQELVRLTRNKTASSIYMVNNYNSLTSFQKEHVDKVICGG